MQTDVQHSLASTSTASTLQTGMAAEELEESPCSSQIQAPCIKDQETEAPVGSTASLNIKVDNTARTSPKSSPTIQQANTQGLETSQFEVSHDEQTLVMMITELENEPTDSDQHETLKRKSDMGVLEIDLPAQAYKLASGSTTPASSNASPVKVDEHMDTLHVDTAQQPSPLPASPKSPVKEEPKQKKVSVSKSTATSPKPLEVLMDTEATASTSTQTGSFSPINQTPKQPSPMDTSQSSPVKPTEACENLPPPPIMPRHLSTNALLVAPPRPPKPKTKRTRPPNLPPIQPDTQDPVLQTRVVETLRLRVEQIRNLQFSSLAQFEQPAQPTTNSKKGSTSSLEPTPLSSVLRIHIKVDGKEIFQTHPVQTRENCVLSDELFETLPSNFQSVQLILVETIDGRITRQVGRKSLKRRELLATTEQDTWIPVNPPLYTPVPGQPHLGQQPICEVLGQLCLSIDFDEQTKELEIRVLDCAAWKRSGVAAQASANKRPSSQQLDPLYAPNPAVTSLHAQLNPQRSLPGSEFYNLSGSTSSLSQRHARDTQLASPLLTKKSAKFSLSPKLSRKNRHSQPLSAHQQKLTGSLSSGFERKRPPSLGNQPLSRPTSPTPPDFASPGAPLYLSACVLVGQTQSPMRRLRIVERRGLEPVRIDCSAISNAIPSTSHQEIYGNLPATAPPYHQRLTIPLTPTAADPILQPSLCIRVSSEPNFDESTCYGSLHIELNPYTMLPVDKAICGPNWYSLKARSKQPITTTGSICTTVAVQPAQTTSGPKPADLSGDLPNRQQQSDQWKNVCNGATVGEMKIRWTHNMENLLPLSQYEPLYKFLTTHLSDDYSNISLLTLIQQLPINHEEIVPPLMKIFVHAQELKPFFRLLCVDYMAHSNFRDANTLFRSQSMVSKSMYEMMKFVGHDYLAFSLKPLIDLIYAKRECCEIDPARLKAGDVLENNQRRLMIYVELAFTCVVESSQHCPPVMREVFAELRSVVAHFFPQREDIERLAVSSFLIMRFFSAAILNPKIFALKREAPEPDVMRTLVLISKVLQRLANCVVSEKPLTTKEEWLTPVLERVSDPAHKQSMVRFLDIVSNVALSTSNEPLTPPSSASPPLIEDVDSGPPKLKFGHMIERRSGSDKKRSFKNLIHQKRRYVTLTENELTWQKVKEGNDDFEPKGAFAVADIRSVAPLTESKHSFCVGTLNSEVHFQANNTVDMNEWMILIEKQQLRHMMLAGRTRNYHQHGLKIDLDRELETIYSVLATHIDVLCTWKHTLDKRHNISFGKDAPTSLDKLFMDAKSASQQEQLRRSLQETVCRAIGLTKQIQAMHRGQALKTIQTNNFKPQPVGSGSPLGSPTALLARSMDYQARVFGTSDSNPPTPTSPVVQELPQKDPVNIVLVDSENYLHLRSGGACKRSRKAPSTNLYDSSNKLSASMTSLGPPPKSPTA